MIRVQPCCVTSYTLPVSPGLAVCVRSQKGRGWDQANLGVRELGLEALKDLGRHAGRGQLPGGGGFGLRGGKGVKGG